MRLPRTLIGAPNGVTAPSPTRPRPVNLWHGDDSKAALRPSELRRCVTAGCPELLAWHPTCRACGNATEAL